MKKKKTSVSLTDNLLDQLRTEAKRQRRSVSQLIEIWLEDALAAAAQQPAGAQSRG